MPDAPQPDPVASAFGDTLSGQGTVFSGERPQHGPQTLSGAATRGPGQAAPGIGPALVPGCLVDRRYRVAGLLGRGGMGEVYRARDSERGVDVALKVLHPRFAGSASALRRFASEGRLALEHPGIVRNLHAGADPLRGPYLAMELVEGETLRARIEARDQPFGASQTWQVLRGVLEALEYAHQYSIHRDLKPENIMLSGDGQVKLMDFGIARVLEDTRYTETSASMGTAYYTAPEQLSNPTDVDQRSDLFAVGVIAYELLTGSLPVGRFALPSQLRPELPTAVDQVLARALASDPGERFASAAALRTALERAFTAPEQDAPAALQDGSLWRCPRCRAPLQMPASGSGRCYNCQSRVSRGEEPGQARKPEASPAPEPLQSTPACVPAADADEEAARRELLEGTLLWDLVQIHGAEPSAEERGAVRAALRQAGCGQVSDAWLWQQWAAMEQVYGELSGRRQRRRPARKLTVWVVLGAIGSAVVALIAFLVVVAAVLGR